MRGSGVDQRRAATDERGSDHAGTPPGAVVLQLRGATATAGGETLVGPVDWSLRRGDHAVLLGPNGAGKTTLLELLAGLRHPHAGSVEVLGERIGRVDVRRLRRRIGIVSDALGDLVDRGSRLRPLVAAHLHGMTTERGAPLRADDLARAHRALDRVGIAHLGDRHGTEVSQGEWQRALLARATVGRPALLLLDEPVAGLDLAERERFVTDLDVTLRGPDAPTAVLVTHHLAEVPPAITHALLLRRGTVVAAGPVDTTVTGATMSATFEVDVAVTRLHGRLATAPARRG